MRYLASIACLIGGATLAFLAFPTNDAPKPDEPWTIHKSIDVTTTTDGGQVAVACYSFSHNGYVGGISCVKLGEEPIQ